MKGIIIAPIDENKLWHYICHKDGLLEATKYQGGDRLTVGYKTGSEGGLTRKQYQSLASIGLASCVTYGLGLENIECVGVEWDEIVRKG